MLAPSLRLCSLLALGLLGAGCGGASPGGSAATVIPTEAAQILYVPSLGQLGQGILGFSAGLDGGEGLTELLAERYGLDVRSPEGLDAAGLDARGDLAIYRLPDAWVLGVSTHRPGRLIAHASRQLLRSFGARPADRSDRGAPRPGTPEAFTTAETTLAAGVTAGGVGLFVMADPAAEPPADPVALWQRLAALPPAERVDPARLRPEADAPDTRLTLELAGAPPGLQGLFAGMPTLVSGIVRGLVDSLGLWRGLVAIAPDRLAFDAAASLPEDSGLPLNWLEGRAGDPPLAAALPRNTPAFVRVLFNASRLRRVPAFVRDRFLPDRLPMLETAPLPGLPLLVETLGDEVAIAFFGLQPGVALTALLNVRQLLARWPRLFRFGFLMRVHDRDKLLGSYRLIAEQFGAASEWQVAPITPPEGATDLVGWTFTRRQESFGAILVGDVFVFAIGAEEVDNLLAVQSGKLLPLTASLTADEIGSSVTADALGLSPSPSTFGVHLGFLRVTRELVERGAPPFFIRVLNSVHSVAFRAAATADSVRLGLEVRL